MAGETSPEQHWSQEPDPANRPAPSGMEPSSGPSDEARPDDLNFPMLHLLDNLCGRLDPRQVRELVGIFIEDSLRRIGEFGAAIDGRDREGVRVISHDLRGSCGHMGAVRIAELCTEISTAMARNDQGAAQQHLGVLKSEFAHTRRILEAWISRQGA
jgi:histidine phosphotransfer protein HptB